MRVPRLLLALALVGFSTSTVSVAKGGASHGGGHSNGGQAGSHPSDTHPAGPSHARPAPATIASTPTAKTGGVLVIGSAALPVVNSRPDLFLATPNTYAPQRPIRAAMATGPFMIAPDAPSMIGPANDSTICVTCDPSANNGYEGAAPPYDAPASDTGEIRLDVQPGIAQIFVDGYFVGTVDDFYHSLAGLGLRAGPRHVEFRAPGYETIAVDMMITAGRTITYRAALKPLQP